MTTTNYMLGAGLLAIVVTLFVVKHTIKNEAVKQLQILNYNLEKLHDQHNPINLDRFPALAKQKFTA